MDMSTRHFPIRAMGISAAATYILYISPGDVEPNQLNDAQRAWVDGQHTEGIASIQHDRACHCRLEDDAPGDTELGAEVVGAGGKDNAAEGGVGECAGQAGGGAHRCLQLTAVAGHKLLGVQPGTVAGLGAGQHSARERRRRQYEQRWRRRLGWHPNVWSRWNW